MPFGGHQTACEYELREHTAQGALYGNSHSGRRATIIMLTLGIGLGTALFYQMIIAVSVARRMAFGVGVAFFTVWSLWLLWRTAVRLELRTDRGEGKVTLRKRYPFSNWSLFWQLKPPQVDYILLAHGRTFRTVKLVLNGGRQISLDEGVDIEALESLTKELAETLKCPIREA